MRILSLTTCFLLFIIAGVSTAQTTASGANPQELRQLMQLAEYIGVDYSEAVADGKIINQGEFAEMQEFAQLLLERGDQLPSSNESAAIRQSAQALSSAIERRDNLAEIQKHTASLRQSLLTISPQLSLPAELLPINETAAIFRRQCVACHGVNGAGDGPLATSLEPTPTNFLDHERAEKRSLLGLYDAISNGIDGTSMAAFKGLNDQQRWSLAFYVGSKAFAGAPAVNSDVSLEELVQYSPDTLRNQNPQLDITAIAALRADPTTLFAPPTDATTPIEITRERLQQALAAYQQSDFDGARTLAVSAYLDGFELVESSLDTHDSVLRKSIESDLLSLRTQLRANSDSQQVTEAVNDLLQRLEGVQTLLEESQLSSPALFLASLIILLREGLEALLVVLALGTILVKTQRRDALKYVHLGWIGALAAGYATWLLAQKVIHISGANRETMEGVAALLAAVVLFYVGFWMHSKTQTQEWQAYIRRSITHSLSSGALWGIAGLSFIAVYREVFETILFYQSLLSQTGDHQISTLWGGLLSGFVLLAIIGWLLVRYSARLPIGQFFSTTTYILLALSFVLAGKAIAALQEAALVAITPLPVAFSFEWLGIYSSWQGITVQLAILLASSFLLLRSRLQPKAVSETAHL